MSHKIEKMKKISNLSAPLPLSRSISAESTSSYPSPPSTPTKSTYVLPVICPNTSPTMPRKIHIKNTPTSSLDIYASNTSSFAEFAFKLMTSSSKRPAVRNPYNTLTKLTQQQRVTYTTGTCRVPSIVTYKIVWLCIRCWRDTISDHHNQSLGKNDLNGLPETISCNDLEGICICWRAIP